MLSKIANSNVLRPCMDRNEFSNLLGSMMYSMCYLISFAFKQNPYCNAVFHSLHEFRILHHWQHGRWSMQLEVHQYNMLPSIGGNLYVEKWWILGSKVHLSYPWKIRLAPNTSSQQLHDLEACHPSWWAPMATWSDERRPSRCTGQESSPHLCKGWSKKCNIAQL